MMIAMKILLLIFFPLSVMMSCEPSVSNETDVSYETLRNRMINEQLTRPGRDIRDPDVLEAMGRVERHLFVPDSLQDNAYEDRPLGIGYGQTISQPFIVAFMTEQLEPEPNHRVLEIGTGSGYQAAVLAGLVEHVYTIEIVEELAERSGKLLASLGYDNITVRYGDGYQGWPEEAPFDRIIVTCAPDQIPQTLINELKEGGRMVIPVGPGGHQTLVVMEKRKGEMVRLREMAVRFVPMVRP